MRPMNEQTFLSRAGIIACVLVISGCLSSSDDSADPLTGAQNPGPGGTNSAPTIGGVPPSEVVVGREYIFRPTSFDADNDQLTFTARNLPAWASMSRSSGVVTGLPTLGDVGMYQDIMITVTDGSDNDQLGPFDVEVVAQGASLGSATLSWTAPSENDDGSPLTDLAGFRVYWGTEPNSYPNLEDPMNTGMTTTAGTTTYVVQNLSAGTYYFVATAVNSVGVESTFSDSVSKVIQ